MFEHLNYKLNNISHKFFNKQFENSTHKYNLKPAHSIDEVLSNHKVVIEDLDVRALKVVKQIHSNIPYVVKDIEEDTTNIEADALVTNLNNIALGMLTADCVPVLFADDSNKVIGIAHAGWKGAINNILSNTVEQMNKLGAKNVNISALIGPCIHQESYEVGEEFLANFLQEDKKNNVYFQPLVIKGKYLFDLKSYVKDKLQALNLKDILDMNHNTFAMPSLYVSYRRSTITGEPYMGSLLSTITLK